LDEPDEFSPNEFGADTGNVLKHVGEAEVGQIRLSGFCGGEEFIPEDGVL
jgi:hypothetical protein